MRDIIIVVVTLGGMFLGVHFYDDLIAAIGIQGQAAAASSAQEEAPAPATSPVGEQ